eukprot:TRINITY_DN16303_c0_g2_i2.p1 TRINITY_DN16303_c0_g2~~TRINITY_DN16303_c0_g2_i2.p1  ORF type:complete len:831 (+),score=109.25 TRINITY_DN16303_c0_g2_i2:729-3221(+)
MAGSLSADQALVCLDTPDDHTILESVLDKVGASGLLSVMKSQDVDLHVLATATSEELQQLGLDTIGKRRKLQTLALQALGLDERERDRSPDGARRSVAFSTTGWFRDGASFRVRNSKRASREWRHSTMLPGNRQSVKSIKSENLTFGERKEFNNTLGFGFQPWMRGDEVPLEDQTPEMQHLMTSPETTYTRDSPSASGNVVYTLLFGWWVALLYVVVGLLQLLTVVNWQYGMWCLSMARYILTPFGWHISNAVVEESSPSSSPIRNPLPPTERTPLATTPPGSMCSEQHPGCSTFSLWLFRVCFVPVLGVAHVGIFCITWMLVCTIPTARLHKQVVQLLLSPSLLKTHVVHASPGNITSQVQICYMAPWNRNYLGYSVHGVNIFMLNLMVFVPLNFAFKFIASETWIEDNSILVMICGMLAIVPLSYYIGHSVASVSAQTSFFVGAVLNATFGSIIELIIYFISLSKGLSQLVVSATTGALLACMLLLPGLSMLLGGMRYKEQVFNRKAGSTSALMLLVAISGLFMPSIYYNIYRKEKIGCGECQMHTEPLVREEVIAGEFSCETCNYTDHEYAKDRVYTKHLEPMMFTVAVLLLVCYVVGLVFTLHTHSFIYEEEEEAEELLSMDPPLCTPAGDAMSHDEDLSRGSMIDPFKAHETEKGHGPSWGTRTCVAIMVIGTMCFAVCSETLVDALKPSLDKIGISENFAGLTMIAIIPCIAEFVNAIQFAMADNIKLSLEIGNIAAIQMILVQMPILTFGSALMGKYYPDDGFVLLFPRLNLTAVFLSAAILIYCLLDGTSNYFQGVAMLVIYVIMLIVFYHIPSDHEEPGFA